MDDPDGVAAQLIVRILAIELKVAPGEAIPDRTLKVRYAAHGRNAAEIPGALLYAHARGWLDYDGTEDVFTLTAAGARGEI
jgi:hypothetical protein